MKDETIWHLVGAVLSLLTSVVTVFVLAKLGFI